MPRFKYSVFAAVGLLLLVSVISLIGPKRALAALGFTPVRDVDNGARQPVVAFKESLIQDGQLLGSGTVYTVPTGKRLVVETVSFARENILSGSARVNFLATVNGVTGDYVLPFVAAGGGNPGLSQSLRFYADPGTNVNFSTLRTGTTGIEVDQITISGYLVDLP